MLHYKQLIVTIIISFLITLVLGPIVIPILQKLKIGQSIREEGPKSHMAKSGTPTMGGLIIIAAIILASLTAGIINTDLYVVLFAMIGFGFIGFIDDFIKVVLRRNLGLRAYQKIIGQIIIAIVIAVYQSRISAFGTKLFVPFFNQYWDLGVAYVTFIVIVVVATVNSVNLTDGLDGLAAGVTLIVVSFFSLVAMNWGYPSLSVFCGATTGACLGFLRFNSHPAKVFMGDTGSMALGGAIAATAILLNLTLLIPIVGGIYFAEALSVILQVASFKLTGKRIFRMSPLHHHYELKGWKETKVVVIFWGITLLLCIAGLVILN